MEWFAVALLVAVGGIFAAWRHLKNTRPPEGFKPRPVREDD